MFAQFGLIFLFLRIRVQGQFYPFRHNAGPLPLVYSVRQAHLQSNLNPVNNAVQGYPISPAYDNAAPQILRQNPRGLGYPINVGHPIYPNLQQGYPNQPRYPQPLSGHPYPASGPILGPVSSNNMVNPAAAAPVPLVNPAQYNNRMIMMPLGGAGAPPAKSQCRCGVENPKTQANRIIDGTETGKHQYPWVVQIHTGVGADGEAGNLGGGSIISPIHILTAAHVLYDDTTGIQHELNVIRVIVEIHETKIRMNTNNDPHMRRVKGKIIHESYINNGPNTELNNAIVNNEYDVAILILEKPIIYSDTVGPVCLPATTTTMYENQPAKVIGWGTATGTYLLTRTLSVFCILYFL